MYAKLESLRGVAACLVVLYHSVYSYSAQSTSFVSNAYLFVDLFFILSGFVMSLAYMDKIRTGLPLSTFVALRLGRIYPLHLFMLIVFASYMLAKMALYSFGFGAEQQTDTNNFFSLFTNLFLIHSLGMHDQLTWNYPSWSISVEFFTYLIFFLFTRKIDNGKSLLFPLCVSFLCYFSILGFLHTDLDVTYDYGLIRCVGGFYLGVFLFRVLPKLDDQKYNMNFAEIGSFALMIAAVSLAHTSWTYQVLSIISFFIVLLVFSGTNSGMLGTVLHNRIMRSIGVWSYSIYMVHAFLLSFSGPFIKHVLRMDPEAISGMTAVGLNTFILLVTIGVSRFTYILIEDKCRKLIRTKTQEFNRKQSTGTDPIGNQSVTS